MYYWSTRVGSVTTRVQFQRLIFTESLKWAVLNGMLKSQIWKRVIISYLQYYYSSCKHRLIIIVSPIFLALVLKVVHVASNIRVYWIFCLFHFSLLERNEFSRILANKVSLHSRNCCDHAPSLYLVLYNHQMVFIFCAKLVRYLVILLALRGESTVPQNQITFVKFSTPTLCPTPKCILHALSLIDKP